MLFVCGMAAAGSIDAGVVRGGVGHIVAVVCVGDEQRLGNLSRDNLQFHAVLVWWSTHWNTCGIRYGSGNLLHTSTDCITINVHSLSLHNRFNGFEHERGSGLGRLYHMMVMLTAAAGATLMATRAYDPAHLDCL